MSLESKLTLLVYLKDRAAFTQRLCDYFHLIKYPCHVFFADGSLEDDNEKIIASFKDANFSYSYHRYPKDLTLTDFYAKAADAASKITTPYVMLLDNDDFPIVDSQLKAVEFLETHDDYVGCNGYYPFFYVSKDSSKPYGDHVFFTNHGFQTSSEGSLQYPSYDQDDSLTRLHFCARHYIAAYYSVFRTPVFQKNMKIIKDLNFSDIFVHEYANTFLPLLFGKIHCLDVATHIRQAGSSQCGEKVMKNSWFRRLFLDSTVEEWKKLLYFLSDYLSKETQQHYDHIYGQLLDSVEEMYKWIVRKGGHYEPLSKQIFDYLIKFFISIRNKLLFTLPLKFFNRFPWLVDRLNPLFLTKKAPPHFIKDVKKIITSPPHQ
jgi:glycosyltransferase domain-containing protein